MASAFVPGVAALCIGGKWPGSARALASTFAASAWKGQMTPEIETLSTGALNPVIDTRMDHDHAGVSAIR